MDVFSLNLSSVGNQPNAPLQVTPEAIAIYEKIHRMPGIGEAMVQAGLWVIDDQVTS
jgi:hypothetical protein